jgi:hypothetical protein
VADQIRLLSSAVVAACVLFGVLGDATAETCIDVAPVWAGHPVGFSLLSTPGRQLAAFYDDQRRLTLASRKYSERSWHFVRLPETIGWDSHNYVTMAMDDDGFIHLCANMHSSPLVYFRTSKPGDIESFERIPAMVGKDEARCTYPSFFRGPGRSFLFTYRSGSSGNGEQFYNVYDHRTQTWKRLIDEPLTSGEGKMNAYFTGLRTYEDGYYHLAWVWRDHGGCETNHDLSYARSKDLVHWEMSAGRPLKLPITLATAEIVDPIPIKAGLINGGVAIGFDSKKRLVISYHKYDEHGNNQVYNARLEHGTWKIYRTSAWDYRWEFSGGGSIVFEIRVGPVVVEKDGRLSQTYQHVKYGSGKWILDEATLTPMRVGEGANGRVGDSADERRTSNVQHPTSNVQLPMPGDGQLQARTAHDSGSSGEPGVRYVLRWETLGPNRDRPREGPLPPPSMLRLCRVNGER